MKPAPWFDRHPTAGAAAAHLLVRVGWPALCGLALALAWLEGPARRLGLRRPPPPPPAPSGRSDRNHDHG